MNLRSRSTNSTKRQAPPILPTRRTRGGQARVRTTRTDDGINIGTDVEDAPEGDPDANAAVVANNNEVNADVENNDENENQGGGAPHVDNDMAIDNNSINIGAVVDDAPAGDPDAEVAAVANNNEVNADVENNDENVNQGGGEPHVDNNNEVDADVELNNGDDENRVGGAHAIEDGAEGDPDEAVVANDADNDMFPPQPDDNPSVVEDMEHVDDEFIPVIGDFGINNLFQFVNEFNPHLLYSRPLTAPHKSIGSFGKSMITLFSPFDMPTIILTPISFPDSFHRQLMGSRHRTRWGKTADWEGHP